MKITNIENFKDTFSVQVDQFEYTLSKNGACAPEFGVLT